MNNGAPRRKVLIVEDEPSIRNIMYTLLAGLGCEGGVAGNGREALAMLGQEQFDAVLLDLRCSDLPPDEVVSGIHDLRPSLVGNVLVITGEVSDPQTLDFVERHFLLPVPRDRVFQELLGRLRALLRIPRPLSPPVEPFFPLRSMLLKTSCSISF